MIIKSKEPTVKKSVRLPLSVASAIDDLCEINNASFTDILVQLVTIGIENLDQEMEDGSYEV